MEPSKGKDSLPLIVFHSLQEALAALEASQTLECKIALITAPGAAGYAGVGWFLAIVRQIEAMKVHFVPHLILDCGEAPGLALGAIRGGVKAICFRGESAVREKITNIARQHKVEVSAPSRHYLDLQFVENPQQACLAWIAQQTASNP